MASAIATQSPESLSPDDGEHFPTPLSFFKSDIIHDDNRKVIEAEQQRWRLLTWAERLKLQWRVWVLARQLRKAGYNQLILEREQLVTEFQSAKSAYATDKSLEARQRLIHLAARGKAVTRKLNDLKTTYANYEHFAGWLDYEAQHRSELREEEKREKRIRREMRQEAGWLESLLIDVFRKTKGCHHIYSDNGKEHTRTPKFERSMITPDAHYFYLSASRRTLFSWRWKLPYGVTVDALTSEEVLNNMRAATKRQVDPIWTERGQLMFRVSRLDSPDALPKVVMWRDAMKYAPKNTTKFPYCVGVNEGRKFRYFNLVEDPHILVAGKSQSGKSNLVNGIIATLVSTHSPDELRIVLVDQKGGIEFTHWENLPHVLWDVVKTVDQVQPVLNRLVVMMRQRMSNLEKVKAKDVVSYNGRVDEDKRMARVLVLIDEMNTFVGLGRLTEEIHNLIMLLASQGRAVGIHVVACTQHPEVKVIPGRIKTNMSVRLSGAMPTISSSLIILDNPEAARIPNIPGRFVAVRGLDTLILQVPRILDEDIAGVVSAAKVQYPEVKENLSEEPMVQLVVWDEQRVLKACIEWLNGHLSGQKLHLTLGSESPGERHLVRMCKRLIDQSKAFGYVARDDTDEKMSIRKRKRGYYLESLSAKTDDQPTEDGPSPTADYLSQSAAD